MIASRNDSINSHTCNDFENWNTLPSLNIMLPEKRQAWYFAWHVRGVTLCDGCLREATTKKHISRLPRELEKMSQMDQPTKSTAPLFDVYLRLRPSLIPSTERFIDVEASDDIFPKYITIKPPSTDHRKRAVEKFAFTRVFEENASQLDLFTGTGVLPLIQGVLAADGQAARDGLLATLGVTGSGKVILLYQSERS